MLTQARLSRTPLETPDAPEARRTATSRPKRRYAVKGKAVRWIHTITTD